MTDAVWDYMAQHFPAFIPLIDAVKPHIPTATRTLEESRRTRLYAKELLRWTGIATSLNSEFNHVLMNQLCSGVNPDVVDLALHRRTWTVPSSEELARMSHLLKTGFANDIDSMDPGSVPWTCLKEFDGPREDDRHKYYFSAAAIAIHFLQNHPKLRLCMRKIVLYEDNHSEASPYTHGQGLIPFCAENAQLRIERRLNLWTNLFFPVGDGGRHNLPSRLPRWALEALMLPPAISLVLDGDPATSQISARNFQNTIAGAVWQKGFEESYRRQLLPCPGFLEWTSGSAYTSIGEEYRDFEGYDCEGWPQIVQDIISGASQIS